MKEPPRHIHQIPLPRIGSERAGCRMNHQLDKKTIFCARRNRLATRRFFTAVRLRTGLIVACWEQRRGRRKASSKDKNGGTRESGGPMGEAARCVGPPFVVFFLLVRLGPLTPPLIF